MIGEIGAGINLIGSLVGGISAASQARKAEKELQKRRVAAERMFNHQSNTNYLDTAAAKSALAGIRKQGDKQLEALNTNAIKQGASDEAKIAAAGRIGENQADAISRLAAFGTQYQQQLKDRYQGRVDGLDDALYNSKLNRASTSAGIIDSVGSAVGSGLIAYGLGAFDQQRTPKQAAKIANIPTPKMAGVQYGYIHPITGRYVSI